MSEIVKAEDYGLEESKANEMSSSFSPKVAEVEGLNIVYAELIKKELCPAVYKDARALKNRLAKARTGIAAIHKTEKAYYLAGGRFVDAIKNKLTAPILQMEDTLLPIIKHEEIEAEKVRVALQSKRESELIDYVDAYPVGLGEMDESIYRTLKKGLIAEHNEKIAAELKVEEDRVLAEKVRKEEEEKVRKENEKLKEEAREAEKKRLVEANIRDEKERVIREEEAKERFKIEEKARIEREKQEAIIKKEREENARIQAELKAKEAKELEAKRLEEQKQAKELEVKRKASLAPEKEKFTKWINSFEMPDIDISNFSEAGIKTYSDISLKYGAFLEWATSQNELIK